MGHAAQGAHSKPWTHKPMTGSPQGSNLKPPHQPDLIPYLDFASTQHQLTMAVQGQTSPSRGNYRLATKGRYAAAGTSPGIGGPFGAALVAAGGDPTVQGWSMNLPRATAIC
jgi:hypothetical protein